MNTDDDNDGDDDDDDDDNDGVVVVIGMAKETRRNVSNFYRLTLA